MALEIEFLVTGNSDPKIKELQRNLKLLKPTLNDTEKGFLGINKSILAVGASVATLHTVNKALQTTVNEFIKLENAQIGVRKTTGLNEKEFNKLDKQLKNMSTTMAGLRTDALFDIAEAAGQLGIQGVSNITEFTRVIGMVGLTTELTASESAVSFAKLSNSLNEPIGKIETLASVANELSNTTSATVGDLLRFSQRLSGGAKTAGLMTDEIFGLSATMSDLAINFETGGTNVNRVMLELISSSDDFANAMGINAEKFANDVQDKPIVALQTLLGHIEDLSKTDAANFLEDIGFKGTEVKDVLLKLSSNTELLTKNLKIANDEYKTGTSILTEYEVASAGLEAQNTKLSASFTLLQADIGEKFKEPILEASDSLQSLVDGMRENEEALGEFIFTVSTPLAAIQLFLTSFQVAFNTVPLYFEDATLAMEKNWIEFIFELQRSAKEVLPEFTANFIGFDDKSIQDNKKAMSDIEQQQIELALKVINYQSKLEDVAQAYLNIKTVAKDVSEEIDANVVSQQEWNRAIKEFEAFDPDFDEVAKSTKELSKEQLKTNKEFLQAWEDSEYFDRQKELEGVLYNQSVEIERQSQLEVDRNNSLLEAISIIEDPIDRVNGKFMTMFDLIKEGLDPKQAERFGLAYSKAIEDATDKQDKNNKSVQDLQGIYGATTSIMSEFYDEDDKRKKKQQEVDRTLMAIRQSARLIELAEVLTTETTKQTMYGTTALANALTAPFPTNMVAYATVAGMIASLGIAVGGGGSGGGGQSFTSTVGDFSGQMGAFNQFDANTSLEDAIDELKSAIEVQNRIYENLGDFGGTFSNALTMGIVDLSQGLVDAVTDSFNEPRVGIGGQELRIDFANTTLSSTTPFFGVKDVKYDNFLEFAEALTDIPQAFELGDEWLATTGGYEAPTREMFSEIQSSISQALDDYTLTLIELFEEMDSNRDDWIEVFEGSTGSNRFTQRKLEEALADVEQLRVQIGASSITGLYEELINAYDVDFEELKRQYETSSQAELIEYMKDTFPKLDFNPENVYQYIEALEIVGDEMVKSAENSKKFIDSFKTEQELAEDLANLFDVELAVSTKELFELYTQLSESGGILTDTELELLEANKSLIDEFEDLSGAIDGTVNTIQGAIDRLKDSLLDSNELDIDRIRSFNITEQNLQSALSSGDYERANKLASELSGLSGGLSGGFLAQTTNLRQNLIDELESNKFDAQLEQIDYLELIEGHTKKSADLLDFQINQAYQSTLGRDADIAGSQYWADQIANNPAISTQNIGQTIGASAVVGGELSRQDYITQLYTQGLNRTPNAEELDYWTNTSVTPTTELAPLFNQIDAQYTPFANGGIVTSPTLGLVGEAGYNEAVIPLKDPNDPLGMNKVMDAVNNTNKKLDDVVSILISILSENSDSNDILQRFEQEGIQTI